MYFILLFALLNVIVPFLILASTTLNHLAFSFYARPYNQYSTVPRSSLGQILKYQDLSNPSPNKFFLNFNFTFHPSYTFCSRWKMGSSVSAVSASVCILCLCLEVRGGG